MPPLPTKNPGYAPANQLKFEFTASFRDSNPPVLAGNLPFLGIISALPFSLQNLPFFAFFENESNLLYLFSEIE